MKCAARQFSDQMYCDHCKLSWDMNDSAPPPCEQPEEPRPRLDLSPMVDLLIVILAWAAICASVYVCVHSGEKPIVAEVAR